MLVEAFPADDGLQELASREVIALSTRASIELRSLLGQPATFLASLANGSRTAFHGYVSQAGLLGSEGGFARYRLRISSWLWMLTQVRNSRVWQDKGVADNVDDVLSGFAPYAKWQWSDDAQSLLDAIPVRSYCCQYRESDYDFVRRVLTEEGIAWRFEDGEEEQTLVLFADSSQQSATPEDASSAAGHGLRYVGVVPPALQDNYMTKNLLPHQVKGLTKYSFGQRQQVYDGGRVHDVKKAIAALQKTVGYFVAPPLQWGQRTAIVDPTKATMIGVDVAQVFVDEKANIG